MFNLDFVFTVSRKNVPTSYKMFQINSRTASGDNSLRYLLNIFLPINEQKMLIEAENLHIT